MPGSAHILRANAFSIPLRAASVDLIVTSPPYFALRDYRDGADSLAGQIGSEPHPSLFLEALWAVMRECWRVLKPTGSCFINLGDKRSNTGGGNGQSGLSDKSTLRGNGHVGGGPKIHTTPRGVTSDKRTMPRNNTQQTSHFVRPKSRMALPERFLIGCLDGLADPCVVHEGPHLWGSECRGIGWIHRQCMPTLYEAPLIWEKTNGLPESVTDRTRDNFEYVYHLVKSEQYFSAIDEIREPHAPNYAAKYPNGQGGRGGNEDRNDNGIVTQRTADQLDPRGKVPGSVWRIASEPLRLPTWRVVRGGRTVAWFLPRPAPRSKTLRQKVDQAINARAGWPIDPPMAYFDTLKWMRAMGAATGRPSLRKVTQHFAAFPTALPEKIIKGFSPSGICTACNEPRRPVVAKQFVLQPDVSGERNGYRSKSPPEGGWNGAVGLPRGSSKATITGYACRCPDTPAPTRNAVVLDPFAGTGTSMLVAKALGRTGVGTDLSHPYCKLAEYRCTHEGAKTEARAWQESQGSLL